MSECGSTTISGLNIGQGLNVKVKVEVKVKVKVTVKAGSQFY